MLYRRINIDDYISDKLPNGWFKTDLNFFDHHPHVGRNVANKLELAPAARDTIIRRYRRLNNESRTVGNSPKRGVAVRHRDSAFYLKFLNDIVRLRDYHYGDVINLESCPNEDAESINHFVAGKHEVFQTSKMGFFGPFPRNSMTASVNEFVEANVEHNSEHLSDDITDAILQVFREIKNVDLSGIPDGSLTATTAAEALYGANVQGLATGTFQKSRDQRAGKDIVKMVKDIYQRNVDPNQTVAEVLIALSEDSEGFEFDISENTVTNLKRVQVGGLDIDPEKVTKIILSHVKKAKYRTISANAPQIQIEENKGALAFRKAIVEQTTCSFYNTLCDPDRKWELLRASHEHGHDIGVTQFPFDFQLHDARLHADWMFNLMQHVVKPKFRFEDQVVIDLSTIALVYKIYLSPSRSGRITFHYLVGSLGSGDPWTNILGTLGTRAVGRLLAKMRPDIFYIDEKIGCNNGDDACYGVYTAAIELYGIDEIIRIANEIVTQVSYKFNESKLIKIILPDHSAVAHWEQFAIWYNPISNQVCRHGSTCRYFGKVYGSEDLGRQTPLEGIIDQQSVINNTFGYVGNQTWMTTTFNIDVLREYCLKDDVLQSYLKKHGKAWFETVIDDAVKQAMDAIKKQRLSRADLILLTSDMNDDASDEERYKHLAEKRVLHHLRAAGFDQSGLTKAMHDRDFSFLLTPKLVALGEAELSRIASIGKGRTLLISSIDGELTISAA